MTSRSVAAVQVPILLLLALFFASTTALPQRQPHIHHAVSAREPLANAVASPEPVTVNVDPKNFLKDLSNFVGQYNFKDVLSSVLEPFFGIGGSTSSTTSTTTVIITPTPIAVSSITPVIITPTPLAVSAPPNGVTTVVGLPFTTVLVSPTLEPTSSTLSPPPFSLPDSWFITDFWPPMPTFTIAFPSIIAVSPVPESTTVPLVTTSRSLLPPDAPEWTFSIFATVQSQVSALPSSSVNSTLSLNASTSATVFSALPVVPSSFRTSPPFANSTAPTLGSAVGTAASSGSLPSGTAVHVSNKTAITRAPIGTGTGTAGHSKVLNTTISIKSYKTINVTRTVFPVPVTAASGTGHTPPALTTTARWINSTYTTLTPIIVSATGTAATSSLLTAAASAASPSFLIPLPIPAINDTETLVYAARTPLREVCNTTTARTITLPLLARFYGPDAYPSLAPFPGCTTPSPSQAERAPGLLNCTELGQEVQGCQHAGLRILLSVKASGAGDVGGNTQYGAPGSTDFPFGAYFPADPDGMANGSASGATISVQRNPLPNLFDATHPPSALALTLFSLFGEGHTERADLRPLGEGDDSFMANSDLRWFVRPLGDEVVVDGFDVQVPIEWKGTWQGDQFVEFEDSLRDLVDGANNGSGAQSGGVAGSGTKGKGVVLTGWV